MLNYHTAAACSPTRAMLLTGTDAHLGGLGCLIEYKASEKGAQRWNGKAGYEGYLNKEVAPLSEILQDNGYHTALSGKVSCLSEHPLTISGISECEAMQDPGQEGSIDPFPCCQAVRTTTGGSLFSRMATPK